MARLPPSPQAGFVLPPYAAAIAGAQAARSKDEDNAAYNGKHYRPPSSEVGALVDLEAKGPSHESDEGDSDDDDSDDKAPVKKTAEEPDDDDSDANDDSDDDDSDANDEEPDGEEPDAEEPDDDSDANGEEPNDA